MEGEFGMFEMSSELQPRTLRVRLSASSVGASQTLPLEPPNPPLSQPHSPANHMHQTRSASVEHFGS